jgi:hypothetical protein
VADATTARAVIDQQAAASAALAALAANPDVTPPARRAGRSIGQQFIESDVVAALRHQYPNGIPSGTTVGNIGSVHVTDVMNTLLTDPGLVPAQVVLDVPAGIQVMDLMSSITIITDAPQSIKHYTATFTNNAAVVAEGGLKPESALVWSSSTLNQETIAHHIPVTGVVTMGGTGGGGTTAADFAGGPITAIAGSFLSEQRPAQAAAGSNGGGSAQSWEPFFSFSGMGGGSSNAAAGGEGGNGAYGSGGGGGGAGVGGSRGGNGGNGIVVITCW